MIKCCAMIMFGLERHDPVWFDSPVRFNIGDVVLIENLPGLSDKFLLDWNEIYSDEITLSVLAHSFEFKEGCIVQNICLGIDSNLDGFNGWK